MRLVLYSGGQKRSNHRLHSAVVDLARRARREREGRRDSLSLTYIPFCSDSSSIFFNRIIRRYRAHGVKTFFCLNVDNGPTPDEIEVALQSDIIYLAGGNTFYFLKYLRKTGMLERLKIFAEQGGVLAGLSAGGLIMSPTTRSAAFPDLGPDENEVGIKNFKGMDLFQFEFSPHYDGTRREILAHVKYSKTTSYPVVAVSDGGGIVLNGDKITCYGEVDAFFRGVQVHFK